MSITTRRVSASVGGHDGATSVRTAVEQSPDENALIHTETVAPQSCTMEFMEYPEQPKMATEAIAYDQMYEKLVKLQEEERRQQQLRQHRIWQHVQERVAQQQKLLEEEEAAAAAAAAAASTSTPSTANEDTNAAVQALFADLNAELSSSTASSKVPALKDPSTFQKHKRSIRWSLQNNTIRNSRPAKSALKVRTPNGIQKPAATDSKYFPPRKTAVDFF
ncbi:hypothetical protein BGW42_007816 [Actinomortierella wolfii]|nr:hypothetical protein BGW42_007816 [Actinomortierella wolfii]